MIGSYSFGNITIENKSYGDDVKISRGRIIYPWWRKKGHQVEVQDVEDILDDNPEILVLGKGQPGQMKASQELRHHLQKKGIELIELPTSEAVKHFNELQNQGKKVSAGFHLTC